MKTTRHLLGAAALLFAVQAAQAAGTLTISPATTSVLAGSSFAVQVSGTGFTDKIVGGGFNLSFDPSMLSLSSVTIDTSVWEFVSSGGSIDNAAGTLSDVYFNSVKASLPTGSFAIATLNFSAKAPGSSLLKMSDNAGLPFANDLADVVSVSFADGQVNVSAVPEPASLGLMLAGLLALGLRRTARG